MNQHRNVAELETLALTASLESPLDLDYVLSGSCSGTWSPGAQATFTQVRRYLKHFSVVLPRALAAWANPADWRVAALYDAPTNTIRRPKIALQAKINDRGTLYISVGLVAANRARTTPEDCFVEPLRSDYLRTRAIWPSTDAPGYTLVRLLQDEYPAASGQLGEGADSLREERRQREAFTAFVAALVQALRAGLDVSLVDWVEFDPAGRLVEVSLGERVIRLARQQHAGALQAQDCAAANYRSRLARAGITDSQFRDARSTATLSGGALRNALLQVTGQKVHTSQLKACELAAREHEVASDYEAACRCILADSLKEHG